VNHAELESAIAAARLAQPDWGRLPVRERAAAAGNFARQLADDPTPLIDAVTYPQRTGPAETISAELLPLAEAARWLARHAPRWLAPRRIPRRQQPWWLGRYRAVVKRRPLGGILIIGAGNYPLLLPGVQLLQGLVAGNWVALKPAPGGEAAAQQLCRRAVAAGFPSELVICCDSSLESVQAVTAGGIDKVLLTGSSQTGQQLLASLAPSLTPATLELSGCDAVVVLPSADLDRVTRALLFGLRLNGGATCMAPRRVLGSRQQLEALAERLEKQLPELPNTALPPSVLDRLGPPLDAALAAGARWVGHAPDRAVWPACLPPLVLTDVRPEMPLAQADIFAPLLMLVPSSSERQLLADLQAAPYALCVSIFGAPHEARALAQQINAGCLLINDLIAPTADPGLPFGGRGRSGFGVTRGGEGLLELTHPTPLIERSGRWLPHLDPPHPSDPQLLAGILQLRHGGSWKSRWSGLKQLWRAASQRR
jgi:acyl-CoA reductase-like NAD-dependent aldehyde dehydrogenase